MYQAQFRRVSGKLLLVLLSSISLVVAGCTGGGVSTYTVTYDANGASGGSVPIDGKSYKSGETVTVLGNTGSLSKSYVASAPSGVFKLVAVLPLAAAPTFGPPAGTYSGAQSVVISTTSVGALISFTTDGNTPSAAGGAPSPVTVTVSASETINAIAYGPAYSDSPVATAAYTITGTAYVFSGWNTKADGSGTTYQPGQTFTITSNVTLYAMWNSGARFKRMPVKALDSVRVAALFKAYLVG